MVKKTVIKNGIKLAFCVKLSERFPFSKAINALCIPHPGQSKPVKLFIVQVNKFLSKKSIILTLLLMTHSKLG